MKSGEMKKRVDGQAKLIRDMRVKLGYDKDAQDIEGSKHITSDPF